MRIWRLAATAGLAVWIFAGPAVAASPKVGKPAPDFTATTFGGHTLKLSDMKGEVIVLNFWATWCAPCKQELPILEALFKAYGKYDLQVLAVATEDSVPDSKLRPIAAQMTIPFVKRMKGPYHAMEGVPTNYVIDRSGKLVYAKAGAFDVDAFNEIVFPLLKEPIPEAPAPAAAASPAPKDTHLP